MIKFYSDKTKDWYNSAADAVKAEELHDKKVAEEKAKKEQLANTRKARAEEVENAFKEVEEAKKKANTLLSEFCKDYGAFHKTYKEGETVPALWDWFPFEWFKL